MSEAGNVDQTDVFGGAANDEDVSVDLFFSDTGSQFGQSSAMSAYGDQPEAVSATARTVRSTTYPGFDADILCAKKVTNDPEVRSSDCQYKHFEPKSDSPKPERPPWHPVADLRKDEVVPVRTLCFNIPEACLRRDATHFRDVVRWPTTPTRTVAIAALLGLLFQAIECGTPTGKNHDEDFENKHDGEADGEEDCDEGRKAKTPKPLLEVKRYMSKIQGPDGAPILRPMFQVACEELMDPTHKLVVALRVWILVFDQWHSHSKLFRRAMDINLQQRQAGSVCMQAPHLRKRAYDAHEQRREKMGITSTELNGRFEDLVGLQCSRIFSEEVLKRMLLIHGGGRDSTSSDTARPFVSDVTAHCAGTAGRKFLQEDTVKGMGGLHPLAPEFVFNGKRPEALAFGLLHPNGDPIDVCEEQLAVEQYWGHGSARGMSFCIPRLSGTKRAFFFINVTDHEQRNSIWNMQLPRPLMGSIVPGDTLTRVFLEVCARKRALENVRRAEKANASNRDRGARATKNSMVRRHEVSCLERLLTKLWIDKEAVLPEEHVALRNFAERTDEVTREHEAGLDTWTYTHDTAAVLSQTAATLGGRLSRDPSGKDVICIVPATKRMREMACRLHDEILQPWYRLHAKYEASTRAEDSDDDDGDGGGGGGGGGADVYDSVGMKIVHREKNWLSCAHYDARRDLCRYYLENLDTSFVSSRDEQTLPRGYVAMRRALWDGVEAHGGCASIAFPEQGHGTQLTWYDYSTWAHLREWLGQKWSDVCRIEGRDRSVMDEMYLTMFEPYTEHTYPLIVASKKGLGKSIRAERLATIMPPGMTTFSSASTARAGFHGGMAPSNGKVKIADEMPDEYLRSGEREDYLKTVLTKREWSCEKSRQVKNGDGTDTWATYEVVTDHHESQIICCNRGPCFSPDNEDREPSASREALIQRTVTLFVRKETIKDAPKEEFDMCMRGPRARDVAQFRLFTSLCAYVRLAIMDVPWLRPDLSYAQLVFKVGDDMLVREYGFSAPEPRRMIKRKQNLETMCVWEAVANVYLYKQTAMAYDAGRPVHTPGAKTRARPPDFEIGHLWDVLRTMRPTVEMILDAWSLGLEYSIGTSRHGTNLMSALAEKLRFTQTNSFFRGVPSPEDCQNMLLQESELPTLHNTYEPDDDSLAAQVLLGSGGGIDCILYECDMPRYLQGHPHFGRKKRPNESIEVRFKQLAAARIKRHDFRIRAHAASVQACNGASNEFPIDTVRRLLSNMSPSLQNEYIDALLPTIYEAALYYKPRALVGWAMNGRVVPTVGILAVTNYGSHAEGLTEKKGGDEWLQFREEGIVESAGSKRYDFAWLLVGNGTGAYSQLYHRIKDTEIVRILDMHQAGMSDGLYLLSTQENARLLPKTPRLRPNLSSSMAFVHADGFTRATDSNAQESQGLIAVRNVIDPHTGREVGAHQPFDDTPTRVPGASRDHPWLKGLDLLVARGRLPALQPHLSASVSIGPPLRRNANGLEVHSVVLFEHVAMLTEARLRCSHILGLRSLEDRGTYTTKKPVVLTLPTSARPPPPAYVTQLCDAPDIAQIAWTIDLASRFYRSNLGEAVDTLKSTSFGEAFTSKSLNLRPEHMPVVALSFLCFKDLDKPTVAPSAVSISLAAVAATPTAAIDVSTVGGRGSATHADLQQQVTVVLGHLASEAEINEYLSEQNASSDMHGVEGDVFDLETFRVHLHESMHRRGNTYTPTPGRRADGSWKNVLYGDLMLLPRLNEQKYAKSHPVGPLRFRAHQNRNTNVDVFGERNLTKRPSAEAEPTQDRRKRARKELMNAQLKPTADELRIESDPEEEDAEEDERPLPTRHDSFVDMADYSGVLADDRVSVPWLPRADQ